MIKHSLKVVQSNVQLIAHTTMQDSELDTNLMPVYAARVSHGQDGKTGQDVAKDERLIKFLAEHQHTSPFEHLSATFRVTAPLYVAREWMRHRTQSYNEISMRYTSDFIGEVHFPSEWRGQDGTNRQVGSGNLDEQTSEAANALLAMAYRHALSCYDALISLGVCREQARSIIPVGHSTHFYATANILNWAKFCKLRCAKDAQAEIRELALEVSKQLNELFPLPWKYLIN